jgi:hypothetical protein
MNDLKTFFTEAFDRKTRMEMTRTAVWTAVFAGTFFGIRKLLS